MLQVFLFILFLFFILKDMRDEKLLSVCKDWMSKQDKLELFRDYNDYLDWNQVAEFLDYCEKQIKEWNYLEPSSYLYDYFTEGNRFNDYENENFYEAFMKPFEEQYWEEEWFDYDEANEILRELMYDMDLYDANIDHFDKDYHFYLFFFFQAEDGIRDKETWLEFRRVLFRSTYVPVHSCLRPTRAVPVPGWCWPVCDTCASALWRCPCIGWCIWRSHRCWQAAVGSSSRLTIWCRVSVVSFGRNLIGILSRRYE